MNESVENLLLEHLKRFQAGQDRIERKLEDVVNRIGHLEVSVARLRRDCAYTEEGSAGLNVRMDRINDRVERIERRMELV